MLQPKRTYFTHMCHDVPHAATQAALPPGIYLAYDGLEIEVEQSTASSV
jgi:phosphoribosyl 1,2-cyclic phosphate phosphodiesterase